MVHVPAKFRENTSMHFRVTVRKLNVTDGQTDGQTDGRTDWGRCNISRPGPSARWEINNICMYILHIILQSNIYIYTVAQKRMNICMDGPNVKLISFDFHGLFAFNSG